MQYDVDTDEGAEMAEEFKVHSLIAMTSGCRRIGVPYYGMSTGECSSLSMDARRGPESRVPEKLMILFWTVKSCGGNSCASNTLPSCNVKGGYMVKGYDYEGFS